MIEIRQLNQLNSDDLDRLVTGYITNARYLVNKTESERQCTFTLELVPLEQPYVKRWDPVDADTLDHYRRLLPSGFSFGAYAGQECAGLVLCEPRSWHLSLWVLELHVAGAWRGHGIGRQLMETLEQKARAVGLRILVCETQNTNIPAINFYRKMGFDLEGLDLSYYSNDDYPDGEIALFMKKRLV
jgi:ribosomal protein S18 acetylase RimI-like enzyme